MHTGIKRNENLKTDQKKARLNTGHQCSAALFLMLHLQSTPLDAFFEGSLMRFRPIMMTTMAALLDTLPIAKGFGADAESRRPLGLSVVGGLMVLQLLTLYITPGVYVYLEAFKEKVSHLFKRHSQVPVAESPTGD
jgi:hypothetical protein